jgi:hypothetical protein
MKVAMRHLGLDLGEPHRPYAAVSAEHDAEIGDFLREAGLTESGSGGRRRARRGQRIQRLRSA